MRSSLLVPALLLAGVLPLAGADVVLDWNDNTESDLAAYRVYRATTTPVTVGSGTRIASDVRSSAYVDSGRPVGTWYYVVTAVDVTGNESVASNMAVAVVADGNGAPVIDAGPTADPALVTGTTTRLSVQASDPDGDPLIISWRVTSMPTGATSPSIGSGTSPTVTFAQAGSYVFQVTVSDGQAAVTDDVPVSVGQQPSTIDLQADP